MLGINIVAVNFDRSGSGRRRAENLSGLFLQFL
jgi:hypothetical protein